MTQTSQQPRQTRARSLILLGFPSRKGDSGTSSHPADPAGQRRSAAFNFTSRPFHGVPRLRSRMQFTFKREAIAMAMLIGVPTLLGLIAALLAPLFLR